MMAGMATDPTTPFRKNPFNKSEELVLLKIPDAPETHEPRKSLRSYLAPRGGGGDMSELAAALGGGRRQKKIVERVRDTAPPDEDDGDFTPPTPKGR